MTNPSPADSAHPYTPNPQNYDFRVCKLCKSAEGVRTYELGHVDVFVCHSCGFHYANVLAPVPGSSVDAKSLQTNNPDPKDIYEMESNPERLDNHVRLVGQYVEISGSRILDVGCGGGRFLAKALEMGAGGCRNLTQPQTRRVFEENARP